MRSSIAGFGCSFSNGPDAVAIAYYLHGDLDLGLPNSTAWPAWTQSVSNDCQNVSLLTRYIVDPFNDPSYRMMLALPLLGFPLLRIPTRRSPKISISNLPLMRQAILSGP